jgi:hypothetical protein
MARVKCMLVLLATLLLVVGTYTSAAAVVTTCNGNPIDNNPTTGPDNINGGASRDILARGRR